MNKERLQQCNIGMAIWWILLVEELAKEGPVKQWLRYLVKMDLCTTKDSAASVAVHT